MDRLDNLIQETQSALKPVLNRYISDHIIKELIPILKYCTEAKETYDRALFVRLGCEALGGDWKKALPAMAGAELMDFSVLAIDDILDEALRRMERPTVYRKWDTKTAVIASFILNSLATVAFTDIEKKGSISYQKILEAVSVLSRAHQQIYIGQYLDTKYETLNFDQVTTRMYLRMITYTTGVQISACISIGGILAKGKEEQIRALKDYGLYTGMIFQIRDDLIDYVSNETLTRKPSFGDFIRQKKRIPLLLAHKNNPLKFAEILQELKNNNTYDANAILGLIQSSPVIKSLREILKNLARKALSGIEVFPSPKHFRNLLEEIVKLGIDI